MASEAGKYRLGLFLLAAAAVLIGAVFVFGSWEFLSRPAVLVSCFDESVQGLEVGSPVKWRGVQVGRVSRIALHTDARLVQVEMGVERERFETDETEAPRSLRTFVEREVKAGLRARLQLTGITGMKYVELDYVGEPDSSPPCPVELPTGEGILFVPSAPSSFQELQQSIATTAERLAAVDFEGLSNRLKSVLDSANGLLTAPELQQAVTDLQHGAAAFRRALENAEALARDERTDRMLTDLSAFSSELRTLTERLGAAIEEGQIRRALDNVAAASETVRKSAERFQEELDTTRLAATTDAARTAFAETTEAAASVRQLRLDLQRSLRELEQALREAREFMQVLRRNPSVLIRGRPGAAGE